MERNGSVMTTPNFQNTKEGSTGQGFVRAVVALLPLLISLAILTWGFFFIRDLQTGASVAPQLVLVVLAIIWGVGGTVLLFTTANFFVEQLPDEWTQRLQPFIFVGPALIMLSWALVIPAIRTIIASFFGTSSKDFVGLKNYFYVFTNPTIPVPRE